MSNPNQLFLLADHIKLSLLERKRAQSLNLDNGDSSSPQDGHIARSLEQFRDGLESLEQEKSRLEQQGDTPGASTIADSLPDLQKQFDDLTAQFHGFTNPSTTATMSKPNSGALAEDFAHATAPVDQNRPSKTVRFSDTPAAADPSQELFGPYHDNPDDSMGYRDSAMQMDNQQLHQYHSQILEDQDEQLDRLGESIGRQRELSMQIGSELDDQVAMLDDVEAATDRHQTRLDRASRTLGKIARSANNNKQITTIVVLIIILVLLIAILK